MNNIQLLQEKGIELKGKTSGQIKTICPLCSASRKNKRDLCLSVNIEEGVYSCHNCEFKGRVSSKPVKEYQKPMPRLEKLNPKFIAEFERRGISNNTLLRLGVTEGMEWMPAKGSEMPVVCFNYFRDEILVNVKFRGQGKAFKMVSGAELIFYNLDAIKNEDECIIVEGEIDCLTLHECGIYNVVSVPNGASKGSQKLEYLDNCWEYFTGKKKVILMVDNDPAGYELREELARRIGKEICWKIEYPEGCKDSNDVLNKLGKDAVKDVVNKAIQWPVEGIIEVQSMFEDIRNYYDYGYPEGTGLGIAGLDNLISFVPGQLTTVTGIPGSGKSEIVDWLMCKLAKISEWSWAVCSFENQPPAIHATKLMEKFAGKSFAYRVNGIYRMTLPEADVAVELVQKYFHFINLSTVDLSLRGLLEKAKELVTRKGVKGLVIDPWNYIEHKIPAGYSETQYISECLTDIKNFALQNGVHVFLIAHPTKIQKGVDGKYLVPTLYNISGSAHFFNKTDNGITVYRDFETGTVTIYVQKVRFSWLGKIGFCSFEYNTFTRQYKEM
jgi:twinkle protein